MKIFLHILKRFLNEKCPDINFEFSLSHGTKNVNIDLNCSILTLQEHDQFISAIEEIWLLKRQVTKFKFVMPQLIDTTKWKFD